MRGAFRTFCVVTFATLAAAVASAQTPDLQLSSDKEAVLAYEARSNAVRTQLTEAHKLPAGAERDKQIETYKRLSKEVDASILPSVEKLIDAGFWKKTVGRDEKFDGTMWLAVQHSGNLALQQRTLTQLEPLVTARAFDGEMYGLLYDRVAGKLGRPQRYGTQLSCKDGKFVFDPIDDPENLDERRKKIGFEQSSSEYLDSFKELSC
jgi:hypothetical protein